MEVDTGSAISVIPYGIYQTIFADKPLIRTATTLKTYSGQVIKPAGTSQVNVKYETQECRLELYVVKTNSPPLFGRSWLKHIKLDWGAIKLLRPETNSPSVLTELLQKYDSVFNTGIGTVKGVKERLILAENANPKFCKARPVPYALRKRVDDELDMLESEGIISKKEISECAIPIVPIPKSDGTVRICGAYKVMVNPQLQVDQYPLPRIEDIFASLAGGQKFTKLDLHQDYLQMELHDDSKDYLTINTNKGLYQYNRLVFGIASAPRYMAAYNGPGIERNTEH